MTTRIMGRYEVIGLLGSGGIGQVYAAQDQMLGRTVALKALRPEFSSDRSFLERFHAEAASLARLSHQNIATLYDLQADGQQLYMIMELVRGHTLEAALTRSTRLGVQEALAVTAQTIAGLAYAHRMGVIHRDIKPSNLMLTDSGTLKVMDFGIARVRGSQRLTRTGNIVGTLAYVAPEQIKGGEGDERSDLYSLASVVYEMLAGDPPFNAGTEYELIRAQVEASPEKLRTRLDAIPAALDEALMRALAKDPQQRFASVEEFGQALGSAEISARAAEIIRENVVAPMGPTADPAAAVAQGPMLDPTISAGGRREPPRSVSSVRGSLSKAAVKAPDFIRNMSSNGPIVALGGAAALVILGFGYLFMSSGQGSAVPSRNLNASPPTQVATTSDASGYESSSPGTPHSSFILPPPDSQTGEPLKALNSHMASVSPASAPANSENQQSIQPPHPDESPAYIGRVADWPGPNLIAVPMGGSFGLKFLKLYGILDASAGQAQADKDHQKMKNFLAAAGNKIVCYARGEGTFQCYAAQTDIGLWAVKNGFAKPASDAPKEYLEGRN